MLGLFRKPTTGAKITYWRRLQDAPAMQSPANEARVQQHLRVVLNSAARNKRLPSQALAELQSDATHVMARRRLELQKRSVQSRGPASSPRPQSQWRAPPSSAANRLVQQAMAEVAAKRASVAKQEAELRELRARFNKLKQRM